ncbi:MAG: long-chain fatty acid--CoA ligase [Spirochaetes bacterium]|nr:long-chain fatty acid--CoA ligase [Spirochaetota bacterium]
MYEECQTIVDLTYRGDKNFPDKPFLKYRENEIYQSITFSQFRQLTEQLAASLYELGLRKGDKVGIVSDNLYKWLVTDMAILSIGAVDVPRGSDTQPPEVEYILQHSEATMCFVEDSLQADKVINLLKNLTKIKNIILLTGEISGIKEKAPSSVSITTFDDLMEKGKTLLSKYESVLKECRQNLTKDDLATIIYTSGTTGAPKGVMLLHKNIMQNVHSMPEVLTVTDKDRWLSVLPVWHVFERTVEYCAFVCCSVLAYSKPTARYLLPDMAEIKPTYMVSVPRIWESIYAGIIKKINSGSPISKALFYFFTKIGLYYSNAFKTLTGMEPHFKKQNSIVKLVRKILALLEMILLFVPQALGNLLVFKKIRAKTGGCLKGPISGGGKLPEYVDDFFAAIKIDILEGYGLTETAPIVSVRNKQSRVRSTIGRPAPGVEVMIGDENWQPLSNQHDKGVVYIKGDLVMAGYYKEPEKTAAILKNGWLNTGDLGRKTITNEVQIIGRAKDTIVLMGGENIEPEPIEGKLLESHLINQIIVVGQDKKNLGALVIPDEENLILEVKEMGIKDASYLELIENEKIKMLFADIIKDKISHKNHFRDFEKITCFKLLSSPFEIGVEMTQTLKLKRNIIHEKYHNEIEEMYTR